MKAIEMELALPENTYLALKRAAEGKRKSEAEFVVEAIETYLKSIATVDPLLGLFADKADLVDTVGEEIMRARETTPMRIG